MVESSALLAHILSQTRQNIDFLIAQNQISPADGRQILAKLPSPTDPAVLALSHQTQNLILTPPNSASPPVAVPTPAINHTPAGLPTPRYQQARAIWNYNELGQDPNDLSFHAGNIIDIIAETNEDWWTGRYNGKQGLFPSNYVEKLPPATSPSSPPTSQYSEKTSIHSPEPMPHYPAAPQSLSHYAQPPAPYQPSGGYQGPPPPTQGGGYGSYGGPPPGGPGAPAPPAPSQEQPPKKSMFGGKLGSTLAHSAAGGVGFGAGSAVGSGIINAIF